VLRNRQRVDFIVFRVRADELHECDLAAKIERDYQSIIAARDLEPNALAVQNLRLRRRPLNLMARCQSAARNTASQRSSEARVSGCCSANRTKTLFAMTRIAQDSMFPIREQENIGNESPKSFSGVTDPRNPTGAPGSIPRQRPDCESSRNRHNGATGGSGNDRAE
jgi:hypothetical protein